MFEHLLHRNCLVDPPPLDPREELPGWGAPSDSSAPGQFFTWIIFTRYLWPSHAEGGVQCVYLLLPHLSLFNCAAMSVPLDYPIMFITSYIGLLLH